MARCIFSILPSFRRCSSQGVKEHGANGAHPKPQFDVPVHNLFKIRVWRRGRDSNPRWRLAITVFKTVAIDHSATPPDIASGRAGGTRTPNRRFWRPLL